MTLRQRDRRTAVGEEIAIIHKLYKYTFVYYSSGINHCIKR